MHSVTNQALALAVTVLVAVNVFLLWSGDDEPRNAFCQASQAFVFQPTNTRIDPHVAQDTLAQMARIGPEGLRDDLVLLSRAKQGPGTEAELEAGDRVRDYLEQHCALNVSGSSTVE